MILIVVCISQYICISQIMVSDEHLFVVFAGHLYIFFGEMSFKVFCPLFAGLFAFLILSCMNCLNVLEINPLSVVSVARIFFSPILKIVFSFYSWFPLLCKSF